MDLGTTITGIIILLICIIPFVIMYLNNQKREKKLLQELSTFAERNNCKISQHELWNNNSLIGIDETANMIFFIKKLKGNEIMQQINLTEIQKCRVINSGRTVSNKNGSHKVVDKLDLAFTFHDKNKEEIIVEFYNADYDSLTLSGELQLVEKWCKIINDRISSSRQKK
ncbi:MAG: hypothetical protein IT266_10120 [Saprospiraceae bacterium]|nr:hypothetical protein [Saprospiraceae bacterium]